MKTTNGIHSHRGVVTKWEPPSWVWAYSLCKPVFAGKTLNPLFLVSYNPTLCKVNSSPWPPCHTWIGKSLFGRMSSFLGLKKARTSDDFPSRTGTVSLLESTVDILCQGIFSKLVLVSYLLPSVRHVTWSSQKETTPVFDIIQGQLIRALQLRSWNAADSEPNQVALSLAPN